MSRDDTAVRVSHQPSSEVVSRETEPGVFLLDHHFRGSPGVIASYLVADRGELTLIETGPASTLQTLLTAIRHAGFDPADIERVIVTHIHLDHAGGAGALLRLLPRARLFVHPVGAPHMIDPERLMSSATRIYGDLMGPLWGEMLPVPADRVTILSDGEAVLTGGRTLTAHDTPGHAFHHLALHDPDTGAVFTGDIAGVRLEETSHVRPPTPPPEFLPEAWQRSIRKLRSLSPSRLYLTHFGVHNDAEWHLDEILSRVWFWSGWVGSRVAAGEDPAVTTDALRAMEDVILAEGRDPSLARRYEEAGNYRMSVDGIARWWRKRVGHTTPL